MESPRKIRLLGRRRNLSGSPLCSHQYILDLTDVSTSYFRAKSTTMPPERHSRVTSRQRPISCYFCRSRKLRCSRETPCTNCETRGLVCQIHSAPSHGRGESETTDSRRSDSESSENADLRRRLERLEAIISGSQSQTAAIQQSNVETRTQEDPPVDQPIVSATDHRLATDAAWLEKAFTDPNPLVIMHLFKTSCRTVLSLW